MCETNPECLQRNKNSPICMGTVGSITKFKNLYFKHDDNKWIDKTCSKDNVILSECKKVLRKSLCLYDFFKCIKIVITFNFIGHP